MLTDTENTNPKILLPSTFANFYFYRTEETARKQHTIRYQNKKRFLFCLNVLLLSCGNCYGGTIGYEYGKRILPAHFFAQSLTLFKRIIFVTHAHTTLQDLLAFV